MPFTIVRQDITKMKTDAIVNAANTQLRMGGGVCGAIFRAAGAGELQAACDRLSPISTGGAAITPGFRLPAKYVIHAAGPVYRSGEQEKCEAQLRSAYQESLRLAEENGCSSIAFPLISSGIYGYPKAEALTVATEAIRDYLSEHDMDVYLAVFDTDSFRVSEALLGAVDSYIDQHYVRHRTESPRKLLPVEKEELDRDIRLGIFRSSRSAAPMPSAEHAEEELYDAVVKFRETAGLDELIGRLDEPFSAALLKLIDAKGLTDVEVYKRANLDRKLFSKIRTGKNYTPRKATILALAVAMELTLEETDDLLERAGYALSHASMFDVIVEFFIVSGNYDIFQINQVLFEKDQPLLGG